MMKYAFAIAVRDSPRRCLAQTALQAAPQGRGRGGPPPPRPAPLAMADHAGFESHVRRLIDEGLGRRSGVLARRRRRVDR